MVVPRNDQPYLSSRKEVPDNPGLNPETVDLDLRRGIWIEGKSTDKETGKPVQGQVSYFAQPNNPNVGDYVLGGIAYKEGESNEDGSSASPACRDLVSLPSLPALTSPPPTGTTSLLSGNNSFRQWPEPCSTICAVARIDPASGIDSMRQDVTLDPGWTVKGTVFGPDRQALTGAWGIGLGSAVSQGSRHETMKTAEFTISGFNPLIPRDILFKHPTKKLVGVARLPKERNDSITVMMEPCVTVTGRLVDINGRPRRRRIGTLLPLEFRTGRTVLDPLRPARAHQNRSGGPVPYRGLMAWLSVPAHRRQGRVPLRRRTPVGPDDGTG